MAAAAVQALFFLCVYESAAYHCLLVTCVTINYLELLYAHQLGRGKARAQYLRVCAQQLMGARA